MKCNNCDSELPVLEDGKKGGYCVSCGIPFKLSTGGAQVFDESTLDRIAERVADTMEARAEARRKVRKKTKDDDDDDESDVKRKKVEEDQYSI